MGVVTLATTPPAAPLFQAPRGRAEPSNRRCAAAALGSTLLLSQRWNTARRVGARALTLGHKQHQQNQVHFQGGHSHDLDSHIHPSLHTNHSHADSRRGRWGHTQSPRLRVVVVGGGPGGLALACGLAQTLENSEVLVLEGRPATTGRAPTGRSHTIGLGRRAREALIEIGGKALWERICGRGLVASSFALHLNGVAVSLPPPEGEQVVLVDRGQITAALREHLDKAKRARGVRVSVRHGVKVGSVDLVHHRLVLDGGEEIGYDLLIGADGVRSRVRQAMGSQLPPGRFESELRLLPGRWKVLHMPLPASFDPEGVHAMVSSTAPFGLFCIPSAAGPHCVIVSWSSAEEPVELLEAKTPEQLEAALLRHFPGLEHIPADAASAFLEVKPSKSVVSRCRPLHNADHAACLLGDAAHAVGGGSLGQGCSAALQDAATLAQCLREGATLSQALRQAADEPLEWVEAEQEALASALAAFSDQRAAEGWALPDLIELQSAAEVRANALVQSPLVMAFLIEQLGRGTLKPFADFASRMLRRRIRINQRTSGSEVRQFVEHLKLRPTMGFSPAVLFYLLERAVLGAWAGVLDVFSRLKPPMQTALMATNESYSQLVARNHVWLGLLRAARLAAGVSRVSDLQEVRALSGLNAEEAVAWGQRFSEQQRLQDDVLVQQSSRVDTFFAIRKGFCRVLRGGTEVATLQPGDCFGQVALMLDALSPVTVVASTDVTLLQMPGEAFLELVTRAGPELQQALTDAASRHGVDAASIAEEQAQGLSRVRSLLEDQGLVEPDGVDRLLGEAGCELYFKGDVVALGCQRMRVLEEGTCSVVRKGRKVRVLHRGDFFGPDLAPDERVVAQSPEVRLCSFAEDATVGFGLLLGQKQPQSQ